MTPSHPRREEYLDAILAAMAKEGIGVDDDRADEVPQLIRNAKGEPRAILANAITMLRTPAWEGVLVFDEFKLSVEARRPTPWGHSGPWDDHQDRLTNDWLQHHRIYVPLEIAGQAVQTVAMDQRHHPVRDHLNGLRHDGTPRLDRWLTTYMGVEDCAYTNRVGAAWLVSAVARVMQPGVKVDTALILEGPQGLGKSQALRILAQPWFTDEIADLGSKDAAMQTRGVWIVELAELSALGRSDIERIKSFLSRQTDRFRPPYGKRLVESHRQCVFAGTTNSDTYLLDPTGARRFWPVRCGQLNLAALERDRNQLWAEALIRVRSGASWWLKNGEAAQIEAEQQQADRYCGHPWQDPIRHWLIGRGEVTITQILDECLQIETSKRTRGHQMDASGCLRALGWVRRRADRQDAAGRRPWVYVTKGAE